MRSSFPVTQARFTSANQIVETLERRADNVRAAVQAEQIARSHGLFATPATILAAIAGPIELSLPSLLAGEETAAAETMAGVDASFERLSRRLLSICNKPEDLELAAQVDHVAAEYLSLIESALKLFRPLRDKYVSELADAAAPTGIPDPNSDGPHRPRALRWNYHEINDVQPKVIELLCCLWNSQRSNVADVEQAVWGDEAETDDRLKAAIKKANAALSRVGYPGVITRSGSIIIFDKQGVTI